MSRDMKVVTEVTDAISRKDRVLACEWLRADEGDRWLLQVM